jgi:hypothetical protein
LLGGNAFVVGANALVEDILVFPDWLHRPQPMSLGRETLLKAMADARQQAANENADDSGGEEDEEPITQEQLNKLSAKVSLFLCDMETSLSFCLSCTSPWCRTLCHWCFCACF